MTITPISGYDPNFTWQVGYNSLSTINNLQKFRATIRPIAGTEEFSRVPNNIILYEETGISINSSNQGQWKFGLSTNASISGGPYRDYQVIIEAHDDNGNTSAGNIVGGISNENGWIAYPNGYDIIAITNPRQTGIELQNNIPTYDYSGGNLVTGNNNYLNTSYIGPNGDVTIHFTSGILNSNLVGGYIYVSSGQFPKQETLLYTGYWSTVVNRGRFDFDPTNPIVYHPTVAKNLRNLATGFVSVSFYDNLDSIVIQKQNQIDISTGLYLSNNAVIYNDASIGRLTLGGSMTLQAITYTGDGTIGGYNSMIDFTKASILSSGVSPDGYTVVIYSYPSSGSMINW